MTAHHSSDVRTDAAIRAFVCCAYALSIALSLLVGFTGGSRGPLIGLRFLSMFLPAVAVLIVSAAATAEPLRIEWNRFPLEYAAPALFLLPVAMHVGMLPVIARYEGGLPWEDWLTAQADGLYHPPPQRGWGALTFEGLAGRILLNAVVGVTIVSVLALFEEVGWRAWLLPRLARRTGIRRAVVLTSGIWAVWHVPFALSGVQHIDGFSPAALALTLPIGIFAAGLVIGWLWVKTESIWIVSIAHGAFNNWGQYALKYMRYGRAPDLIVGGAGVLAVLVLGTLLLAVGLPPGGSKAPRLE
jgi:membrane protease YdiL (CAAX protease family)